MIDISIIPLVIHRKIRRQLIPVQLDNQRIKGLAKYLITSYYKVAVYHRAGAEKLEWRFCTQRTVIIKKLESIHAVHIYRNCEAVYDWRMCSIFKSIKFQFQQRPGAINPIRINLLKCLHR